MIPALLAAAAWADPGPPVAELRSSEPATAAEPSPCLAPDSRGAGMPEGPVGASLWDGGLGRAQTVCPRSAIGLEGRGYLLADVPAFYGQIVGSGTLDGRIALGEHTMIGLRMEALRYQTLISAIPTTFLGYGHTTISAVRVLPGDGPADRATNPRGQRPAGGPRLALAGQLVLPTAIGLYGHSWPVGLDLGLAAATGSERWDLHGQAGLAASAAISKGATQPRLGVPLTVGSTWRLGSAFAVVLDLQASLGYTAPLDHLAVAPAVRFAAGSAWGLELGATLPTFGRERALAAAQLSTGIRF